jgi:hypothetical protein
MVPLAMSEQVGVDISGIDKVLGRQQPFCGQPLMDPGCACHIRLHRWAGLDIGNQVGRIVIADFRDMHLVPRPAELPLHAEMGFWIIR